MQKKTFDSEKAIGGKRGFKNENLFSPSLWRWQIINKQESRRLSREEIGKVVCESARRERNQEKEIE